MRGGLLDGISAAQQHVHSYSVLSYICVTGSGLTSILRFASCDTQMHRKELNHGEAARVHTAGRLLRVLLTACM